MAVAVARLAPSDALAQRFHDAHLRPSERQDVAREIAPGESDTCCVPLRSARQRPRAVAGAMVDARQSRSPVLTTFCLAHASMSRKPYFVICSKSYKPLSVMAWNLLRRRPKCAPAAASVSENHTPCVPVGPCPRLMSTSPSGTGGSRAVSLPREGDVGEVPVAGSGGGSPSVSTPVIAATLARMASKPVPSDSKPLEQLLSSGRSLLHLPLSWPQSQSGLAPASATAAASQRRTASRLGSLQFRGSGPSGAGVRSAHLTGVAAVRT